MFKRLVVMHHIRLSLSCVLTSLPASPSQIPYQAFLDLIHGCREGLHLAKVANTMEFSEKMRCSLDTLKTL